MTTQIDPSLIEELASRLTDGALPGETEGFDEEARLRAARFVADVASHRADGSAAIRIESIGSEGQAGTRIAVINADMPFLVDSIAGTLAAQDVAIDRIIHPVLPVVRNADGTMAAVRTGGSPESMIYLETERVDARVRRTLEGELARVLDQVRHAVSDWAPLQAAMLDDAKRIADPEGAALLRWFVDRNLTLLAHEWWDQERGTESQLGIARGVLDVPLLADASRRRAVEWFEAGGKPPLLLKSNCISPVHRRVPLDLVLVPVMDGGRVSGLSIHAGLWTSAALSAAPDAVPVLRRAMAGLQEKFGFDPKGHTGKALTHALTQLPHDLTIAFLPADLETVSLTAMSIADRPRSRLILVKSPLGRHLFAFVWLPRDEVSTLRRTAIGTMLADAANATVLNWSIELEDGAAALIRFTLDLRADGRMPDQEELNDRVRRMVRGWRPAVAAALHDRVGARSTRLALRWANAFPASYRSVHQPEDAADDIVAIAALESERDRAVRIVPGDPDGDGLLQLKVYHLGGPLPLSEVVPVLENFGLTVIEERPTELDDESRLYIHDFQVALNTGHPDTAPFDPAVAQAAIEAVLDGRAENDRFNRLIMEVGLAPSAVVLLRAWFAYLHQTGMNYAKATVVDALTRAPQIGTALIDRFTALHDPSRRIVAEAADQAAAAAQDAIDAGLAKVSAIDDDRILRAFRGVIDATVRTNAFAPAADEALAFKLDSARVPGLPKPLPWREIFVYSPRVEGIHLRAGPVARGGLRWSDRRDDFRTEILGLMKAQRVKNAVIVPTGAKGGFYPKQLPAPSNREAWLAEGTESYRIFIRTLLSVTDNIVDGRVVHPEGVVIHDGEDPYFVVAADKGTATFSDVANAIALERGFWLGDAFASGGSNGYDHKAMGITARGGWVSVQRHFLEMGVDVQSEPVRVVGCGDMSGDVFGNGMLLSRSLKLVAAFDHRHIFLDPEPDPATSWAERDRLFKLPRSSWDDYDKALISAGGGVFARTEKSIPLSPEVRAALDVAEDRMEPSELIAAILKAPVDLIWFGGIGTYLKAASESNLDVGDPANDRNRVNAEQLRAKVVGEGANLGVTQAARIAFAARGGRINTDFIDNSAGVDCSDNEVNIKIALNGEMTGGQLALADRNVLLVDMTEDVAHLVLEDNRLQTLALSLMEADGAVALPSYLRAIEILEASGRLDRAVEGLAPNDELLRRAQDGRGLTRPELAVLLATAKLALQDAIEARGLGHDPALTADLFAAFPPAMRDRFAAAIEGHRLRGEIVATKLANRIVNRLGVLHPFELAEEEGASLGEIGAMFVVAEILFGVPDLWRAIETESMPEAARLALLDEVAVAMRSQIADLLRVARAGDTPGAIVDRLGGGIAALDEQAKALLLAEAQAQSDRISARLADAGAPAPLVERVVRLFQLDGAVGLADLGQRRGIDEAVLTRAFTSLGQQLGLDWAQANAARITAGDPWERLLIAGLARDFQQLRLDFLARADGGDPQAAVDAWLAVNRARVDQFNALVARARLAPQPSAAMLAQIAGQARVLLGR
ncbi:NAD-glutamate dehydrogenase [Sphingomonas sp. CJ99]